ncbi:putative TIM-barrel fold metal-dependent hydrolase [Actinocorallia herbida]|uniref:Putative TIM-barrel fold metal-dependent hydrolase n=1 Tax=Actinocorallia herbida TaxID=58109 RepID=A0A3N1CW43_9ACTN|nr:amidohydrolase family protein [Actinocorallia herbida]ROO85501.1 putative TIM-barrel fold metal-dependent hydrolase [Actinocorallia herbida]
MATELPFEFFDCDNHYYEAVDAFTRYAEPEFRRRTVQWAEINGRQRLLVSGKVNRFIPNPTFDPVARPGAMDEYFRGRNPKSSDVRQLFGELEPVRPAYRDRDARLALMDEQGMRGTLLLPTLGVGIEQAMLHDLPALGSAFRSFNRWLDDDWGYAYQERIFAAPYITLSDVEGAVAELQRVLDRDARFVVMVAGPVMTREGLKSPADAYFDPFWQLVNDSGITVVYHSGMTYYNKYMTDWGESSELEAFKASASFMALSSPDPVHDTFASMIAHRLFTRFPRLRIAVIESGASWVLHLFAKLKKVYGQAPFRFPEDPRETIKRHVWVSPYYEDDLGELKRLIGVDRILMGSDFPHVEGLAEPASYIKDLENFQFTPQECERIMRHNGWELASRLA